MVPFPQALNDTRRKNPQDAPLRIATRIRRIGEIVVELSDDDDNEEEDVVVGVVVVVVVVVGVVVVKRDDDGI